LSCKLPRNGINDVYVFISLWSELLCSHPVGDGAIPSADVCIENDFDKRFQEDLDEAVRQSLGTLSFMAASILHACAHISGSHEHLYLTPL